MTVEQPSDAVQESVPDAQENAPSEQQPAAFMQPGPHVALPQAPPVAPVRKQRSTSSLIAVALIAGFVGAGADRLIFRDELDTGVSLQQLAAVSADRPEGSIASLAAALTPSVVAIEVDGWNGGGTGSGFVIRSDGYILTNHHVVDGGTLSRITVVFADGSEAAGKVVGSTSEYDIAVVKVEKTGLPTVTLGNSEGVVVGDPVIAIGSPLGLQSTVTSGIVSALNRPVTAGDSRATSYINAIQTDAAINPGNSGGPLIDARGAVIGVNSAIATLGTSFGGESGSIGLGFAIPINQAKRIAEEIIRTGTSRVPVMGILLDMTYRGDGARIGSVQPGTGADEAGLKSGDIITAVEGRTVEDATELIVAIRTHEPGERLRIVLSSGQQLSVLLGADTARN